MIAFRHADPRFPFLWENPDQPAGRWNLAEAGPVQYFADTPDGAWAEFLRHEGITTDVELQNVRRALWAIEIPDSVEFRTPELPLEIVKGGIASYGDCQHEAERLKQSGAKGLRAASAALLDGEAGGWQVHGGLRAAPARDGFAYVLFGTNSDLIGWAATIAGRPSKDLLTRVRRLT